MLGKSCYHTSISGFLYSLSTGTVDSPISFFVCLSRQVNCNDFSSPAPSIAFPTRCLWFRLRRLLSYQMCVRAEGKKDLSFLTNCDSVRLLQRVSFRSCCYWSSGSPQSIFPSAHCKGGSRDYHRSGSRDRYVIKTEELLFGLLLKAQESICGFQSLPSFSLVF